MLRRIVLCLVVMSSTAAADPAPFAITSTRQAHRAAPIVAPGGPGWVVVWEELSPTGPDQTRKIGTAIVGDGGKIIVPAKTIMNGGGAPNDLHAVWNGKGFTVVVCNDAWDGKRKLVWGELTADGAFTRGGEQVFTAPASAFYCSSLVAIGDKVAILATVLNESYGANDELLSKTCATHRVTLSGDKATVAKPAKLCEVWAATEAWAAGTDLKDRAMLVDAKGKTVAPAQLRPNGVAASAGKLVAATSGANGVIDLVWLAPPAKKVASKVSLAKGPIENMQNVTLISLPGGNIALTSGFTIAIYKSNGALAWSGTFGGPNALYSDCAPGSKELLCIWTDDDDKSQGEVRAVALPLP